MSRTPTINPLRSFGKTLVAVERDSLASLTESEELGECGDTFIMFKVDELPISAADVEESSIGLGDSPGAGEDVVGNCKAHAVFGPSASSPPSLNLPAGHTTQKCP